MRASPLGEREEEGDDERSVPVAVGDRPGRRRWEDGGDGRRGSLRAPRGARTRRAASRALRRILRALACRRLREGQVIWRRPGLPPSFIPSLTRPAGAVSAAGSATGGLLGVRGNAFRPEQLPAWLRHHWLFASRGRTEAAADWLAAPAPAERDWVAGYRQDSLREDRELPVRVVSGGPGAVGDWDLAVGRALHATPRGQFTAARLSCVSGYFRTRSALDDPHLSLLTARLTPLHSSKPISGRILFVAFISLWPPAQDPCFVLNLCP